jgi:hypothetical protein
MLHVHIPIKLYLTFIFKYDVAPIFKLWPSARHVEVAAFTAFGRHVSVDGATGTQA